MKKLLTGIFVFTGVGAIGFGLYSWYKKQLDLAYDYCLKLVNAKVLEATINSIKIQMYMRITNKSSFDLKIKGYTLDIYLNNKKVGNVISTTEQTIKNNSVSDFDFILSFDPSQLFDLNYLILLTSAFISNKDNVKFVINGNLKAGMNFLTIDLPVNFSLSLAEMLSSDTSSETKKSSCK